MENQVLTIAYVRFANEFQVANSNDNDVVENNNDKKQISYLIYVNELIDGIVKDNNMYVDAKVNRFKLQANYFHHILFKLPGVASLKNPNLLKDQQFLDAINLLLIGAKIEVTRGKHKAGDTYTSWDGAEVVYKADGYHTTVHGITLTDNAMMMLQTICMQILQKALK